MFAALGGIGLTGKADRLAYVSDVVGRPIATSSDLTVAEALAVTDAANADALPAEVLPDPADGADPWVQS